MAAYEMASEAVTKTIKDPRDTTFTAENRPQRMAKIRSKDPASVPEFSQTQEGLTAAVEYYKDKGGVAFVISRFNAQTMTDRRNVIRGALGPSEMSDAKIEEQARKRVFSRPDLLQKAAALAGDEARLNAEIIEPVKKEILAENQSGNSSEYVFIDDEGNDIPNS